MNEPIFQDKVTPGSRMRCCWEVVAGLLPGKDPMPELSRRWIITEEYWAKVNSVSDEEFKVLHPDGKSFFTSFQEEAQDYARQLTNPQAVNWVRIDWVWL